MQPEIDVSSEIVMVMVLCCIPICPSNPDSIPLLLPNPLTDDAELTFMASLCSARLSTQEPLQRAQNRGQFYMGIFEHSSGEIQGGKWAPQISTLL